MLRPLLIIAFVGAAPALGLAADAIEAIGAERCAGKAQKLDVAFLAPETTQVEARAKILKGGSDELSRTSTLSIDGKACERARCSFMATKGETYRFTVETEASGYDDLCVSIGRP